ncbi:MAG TPA: exodeoxyribonuclease VII large subunit [Rickettsiales bacterium]|nr:exodeoxyribonuclease VII large subunit [Rickettsiales bacterium]
MADLIKEYTVSEIVQGIKNILEKEYFYIKIKGEISGYKKHPSGHCYFSLKDENSIINAVMFKQFADYCNFELVDGLEVIVSGRLTIYKERSNYQILVEMIQVSGEGTLLKLIQERKERLTKEGLFDVERKKLIPKFPKTVGLITAESGAALQDILSRLKNRTPISLRLYSVLMQGKDAPKEIIEAIKYFNKNRPDVIVITRGGGSVEDLMAFNDEELVRCVATSQVPIISAVGHEVDWTLIDYASDLRLPTPTSVAEYLTISKEQAFLNLHNLTKRLFVALINQNERKSNILEEIFRKLLNKKVNTFEKHNFLLKTVDIKLKNIFKINVERYKKRKFLLERIDINKIIFLKFKKFSDRVNVADLKLKNYANKYPILKDVLGNTVKFKKEIFEDKEYILEFSDGKVKIKISLL